MLVGGSVILSKTVGRGPANDFMSFLSFDNPEDHPYHHIDCFISKNFPPKSIAMLSECQER